MHGPEMGRDYSNRDKEEQEKDGKAYLDENEYPVDAE